MFRSLALIILALLIAIIGGASSVNYALNTFDGFGRMRIGQWEAYPLSGTHEADAYAYARSSKRGDISLGSTEGLVLQLWADDKGRPLKAQCNYQLQGQLPEARLFTLYIANRDLKPLGHDETLPQELHSENVTRQQDGAIVVHISPLAQAGNWLATSGHEEFGLILTLYDTPIVASTALQSLTMPSVSLQPNGVKHCE